MLLIPAIDLKEGKCVRLRQGRMDDDTVFSDDPVSVAQQWRDAGARRLHMVDLDGAFAGRPINADVVRAVRETCPDLPVQIGGGIRNAEIANAYIEAGVSFLIIGTQAVREPEFVTQLCQDYPGQVIVGLDARDGVVAVEGWAEGSGEEAIALAQRFEGVGVSAIVYTDIARDGMMQGVNLEATQALAEAINIPVIASGGVSTMDDIERLCGVTSSGISGAIIGRALYEGTIDLSAAQQQADALGQR
ncbi:MAG TPA: 1-(5-phosphoribosyl)-5-((5-phosphoribosylamino)methylideneamino)imidazole-4-carboxamide isomerase [Gammaproteobacteria bacterium]|jgi:phosphoribosylformimino-5-aminoimidazole carboxamide ribotide isomerase|nr:1-(5-phosphoribosyl)-5-((5-phosphoribosylamino)methylideneamino)imidazole-4-carboxamide isomerase [Gammaproteobacteria bacterium]